MMIKVLTEKNVGFSKRGKCCCCGIKHTKEIAILGEQDKYIKLCDDCYKELKQNLI